MIYLQVKILEAIRICGLIDRSKRVVGLEVQLTLDKTGLIIAKYPDESTELINVPVELVSELYALLKSDIDLPKHCVSLNIRCLMNTPVYIKAEFLAVAKEAKL